jgi:ABC-type transport system involved in cytochrome c biogenesis permease subunit
VAVVFAILIITLTILTIPIWLEPLWPEFISIMSKIQTLPKEINFILKSFFEFIRNQIR